MASAASDIQVNLTEIIEEMFLVLTSKEKEVVVKRFSLNNRPRQTLESIGQHFSVTRERIRQIEKIALNKLRRTVQTTRLNVVNDIANKFVAECGGVVLETKLVSAVLNAIKSDDNVDGNIIRLALNINQNIEKYEKTNVYRPFWRQKDLATSLVTDVINIGIKVLKKKGEVINDGKLVTQIRQMLGEKIEGQTDPMILSSLEVDKRLKRTEGGFGLMVWRHINPRSIRDKAYIILKNEKRPLHFVEIANKISESGFDKKVVTVQAVHNELIRYDQFVLVGRGLYALKEFGYQKGTVADVIEALLRKKSPLTKQEIMDGVLEQRHVKRGTISLNLQKNSQFVRVGRAVYKLDPKFAKKSSRK